MSSIASWGANLVADLLKGSLLLALFVMIGYYLVIAFALVMYYFNIFVVKLTQWLKRGAD
jgi:hypothetical protein